MRFINCAYRNTQDDFNDIHNFLKEVYALTGKPQVWEFVRFEFWQVFESVRSKDPDFLYKNAHMWRTELGKLVGLFISEEGDDYFSILVHPEYPNLGEEIVSWAINEWGRNKAGLVTDGLPHSQGVAAILKAGFKEARHFGNTRRYDLENKELVPTLQEGFTIKCITEAPDYLGKWESMRRAYHSDEPVEGDTRYWRADLPSYLADLDLSVISPDGKHVSFCYGFIDRKSCSAIVETVGTHPDYQQRGFGKAVITECFRRLREKGVKKAYITGFSIAANALYQSLGPDEIYPITSYRLEKTNFQD